MKESRIQHDVRLALGQLPDLVLWRNETGAYAECVTRQWLSELLEVLIGGNEDGPGYNPSAAARMIRAALSHGQYVSYGLCKGSADLIGILKPSGRFFALELKTDKGKTTPEQELFLKLVKNMGGYSGVARSVEEAMAHYRKAKQDDEAKRNL